MAVKNICYVLLAVRTSFVTFEFGDINKLVGLSYFDLLLVKLLSKNNFSLVTLQNSKIFEC